MRSGHNQESDDHVCQCHNIEVGVQYGDMGTYGGVGGEYAQGSVDEGVDFGWRYVMYIFV